jgi:Cu2+-exporting ATPase
VESLAEKGQLLSLLDHVARYFVLFVLLLATASGIYWFHRGSGEVFAIVLSVLVVSCPCALSLSAPAALSFCVSALRMKGLFIRRSACLEQIGNIDTVLFDKTGTLTTGQFSLSCVQIFPFQASQQTETHCSEHSREYSDEKYIKELAAALEKNSEHPLASAFASINTDLVISDFKVIKGGGVQGVCQGTLYRLGAPSFCQQIIKEGCTKNSVPLENAAAADGICQTVYLASEQGWLGSFCVRDEWRADTRDVVMALKKLGKHIGLLSGDQSAAVQHIAEQLGIRDYAAGLSPEQKLARIRALQAAGHKVIMVGDGLNDIPVLAQADFSVSVHNASDLAKVRADSVLLGSRLSPLLDALQHGARTRRIIRQNILWALLYNGISLPAAALGMVPPWLAALGMSISSLLVTANSARLYRVK